MSPKNERNGKKRVGFLQSISPLLTRRTMMTMIRIRTITMAMMMPTMAPVDRSELESVNTIGRERERERERDEEERGEEGR